MDGEKTRAEITVFNEQLQTLMSGIRDLNLESVVDVSIDDVGNGPTSNNPVTSLGPGR